MPSTELVVTVRSPIARSDRRDAIRQTWGIDPKRIIENHEELESRGKTP